MPLWERTNIFVSKLLTYWDIQGSKEEILMAILKICFETVPSASMCRLGAESSYEGVVLQGLVDLWPAVWPVLVFGTLSTPLTLC